jgi:sugar/nucleoside kinase (ribokinase family)
MDVLVFDRYFCDLVITGLPELPRLGMDVFGEEMSLQAGGTFNAVRALHRLGLQVGWVCDFGDDLFSQFVLGEVRREGVDTSLFRYHDHPVRSFSLAFSDENDRGFISYMDPVEPGERIPYLIAHKPRSLLLSVLEYDSNLEATVEAAHKIGAQVYMDCQAGSATLDTPGVIPALRAVDVFLPNASEALQLTGAESIEGAFEILTGYARLVVIKMGPDGAIGGERTSKVHVPGIDVQVRDTTGAGDCFNAGFIYGQLRGEPLENCLTIGNICGGLSTTSLGTVATPNEAEVWMWLRRESTRSEHVVVKTESQ